MSVELTNALARLKNLEKEKYTYSTDTTTPTISLLLSIYSKAPKACYINYMQGFKEIVKWLTNNGKLPVDLEVDKYPQQLDSTWKVPALLSNYESLEIAKAITPSNLSFPDYLSYLNQAHKAVILVELHRLYKGIHYDRH